MELVETNQDLTGYPAQVMQMKVTCHAEFVEAAEAQKRLTVLRASAVNYHKPIKEAAFNTHKVACAKEAEMLDPIDEALDHLKAENNAWVTAQEKLRIQAEAEQAAKAAAVAQREREKLEAKAQKAEANGQLEKAEELREQAADVYAAPTSVPPPATKIDTGSVKVNPKDKTEVSVTDIRAFLTALLAQNGPLTMIEVKQSALTAWVKANGIERFDGLRVEKKKVAVVR